MELLSVGIWERDEGIYQGIAACLSAGQVRLLQGRHPVDLAGQALDLLAVSPGATGWAGAGAVEAKTVLLPGTAGPLARGLRACCVISYGTSPRDSLTFSSLEGRRIYLSLQRELVRLDGSILDRQELALPFHPEEPPLPFLATVGVLLLLGATPEALAQNR